MIHHIISSQTVLGLIIFVELKDPFKILRVTVFTENHVTWFCEELYILPVCLKVDV